MSRQVWKFDVPVDDKPHRFVARLTDGAFVYTACQHGPVSVQVWVEVDDVLPVEEVWLQVYGTGHPLPPGADHVGSVVTAGGALVWHVYQVAPPAAGAR